jgi:hypothetical protein
VTLQFGASLTDDTNSVNNDRNMFIIQAKDGSLQYTPLWLALEILNRGEFSDSEFCQKSVTICIVLEQIFLVKKIVYQAKKFQYSITIHIDSILNRLNSL